VGVGGAGEGRARHIAQAQFGRSSLVN
jgi:hypothetical protein